MKFLLDNNLPPALAHALHHLSEREGHQVQHLRDRFTHNEEDRIWIDALAQEGDWVIVSQDYFRKNDLEKKALGECGLVVFCLDKHWNRANYWEKAYNLVRWWPRILDQAERIAGGAAFRVQWRMSGGGKFEQIRL